VIAHVDNPTADLEGPLPDERSLSCVMQYTPKAVILSGRLTAASLSNDGAAPLLLARPEVLVFAGDGMAEGRTRVVVDPTRRDGRVLGFASVTPTSTANSISRTSSSTHRLIVAG
jgi:hypothetical protein